jgi:hypothetical protein
MTACNVATEIEPNPGMMQSIEEHEEIPKKDTVVMPVGGPRKRHRVCSLRTQGYCGSRRKLAAACRKVSCCAKVAWRKGHSYEGPSIEQELWKNKTRNKTARGTRIGRMLGRRQLMRQEGTNGTRNRDIKEQLCLGNERITRGIYRKSTGLEIAK